jgi:hypothetical protein
MNQWKDRSAFLRFLLVGGFLVLVALFPKGFVVAWGEDQVLPRDVYPLPSVALQLTQFALTSGQTIGAGVFLSCVACPQDYSQVVSLYVGARLSDGTFASWRRDGAGNLYLMRDARPHPLTGGIPIDPVSGKGNQLFRYTFSGSEPAGFHLAYALLVIPGTDPLDPRNWISISTVPFTFNP